MAIRLFEVEMFREEAVTEAMIACTSNRCSCENSYTGNLKQLLLAPNFVQDARTLSPLRDSGLAGVQCRVRGATLIGQ